MSDFGTSIEQLKDAMRRLVAERDWEQFHDLKNLSMAIAVEAGELMDHFRWVDNRAASSVMEDPSSALAVRQELADVTLLLLEFAIVAKIDVATAVNEKLEIIRERYPVETAKGRARKHRAE